VAESGAAVDVDAVVAETLRFLTLRPHGDDPDRWVGDAPEWFGEYLFGGFVIAQAIVAATRSLASGRRLHSMHAYFLRPVVASAEIEYQLAWLREGRTFSTRRVAVAQGGKPVLDLTCSFTADGDGYAYDLPSPHDLPKPDDVGVEQGPGPWVAAFLGPTPPAADGTRESTHRMWFRVPTRLPDDPNLHVALLGFATDWTGIGGRPLHLEGDTQGMVSVDHAAWFHRPARADEWLFYDVQSLVNAGGRGLLRGVMRSPEGLVVASVAQEMRITPVETG
jgi:acyl-CoA thioesterase II